VDDARRNLVSTMANLERRMVMELVAQMLDSGEDPQEILVSLGEGMAKVGDRYENCEYFLSELFVAGDIMETALSLLAPTLKAEGGGRGTIVIGTVRGDVHDLGKAIVAIMFRAAGYHVVDLGVDVPADQFVDAVAKEKPVILALSALLTSTMQQMRRVIAELRNARLTPQPKIIIGGRPVTQRFAEDIGADAYGKTAIDAVRWVQRVTQAGHVVR
jgi:5-methyltetrahydrofolate--homocysteine methyltransferase